MPIDNYDELHTALLQADDQHHHVREERWNTIIEQGCFRWLFDNARKRIREDKCKCYIPFLFLKDALTTYIYGFKYSSITTCLFAIDYITFTLIEKRLGRGMIIQQNGPRTGDEKSLRQMFEIIRNHPSFNIASCVQDKFEEILTIRDSFAHPMHEGDNPVITGNLARLFPEFLVITLEHLNVFYDSIPD